MDRNFALSGGGGHGVPLGYLLGRWVGIARNSPVHLIACTSKISRHPSTTTCSLLTVDSSQGWLLSSQNLPAYAVAAWVLQ
jgi:hypothetical protein